MSVSSSWSSWNRRILGKRTLVDERMRVRICGWVRTAVIILFQGRQYSVQGMGTRAYMYVRGKCDKYM